MSSAKPFVFVLMPFDKNFDDIYKLGIKQTAEEAGFVAERVDEQKFTESMLERIYRQIDNCDFVIADMTGKNANVFYEVGYAHAKGKICTLLTQKSEDIPFDLKQHRHLIYDGSIGRLKTLLSEEFEWLNDEFKRQKADSFNIGLKTGFGNLETTDWRITGSIDFEITIRNLRKTRSPEIDSISILTGKPWSLSQSNEDCSKQKHDSDDGRLAHLLKPPVSRLAAGASMTAKFTAKREFWSKFKGNSDPSDTYASKGNLVSILNTSEGDFTEEFNLDVTFEDIPF